MNKTFSVIIGMTIIVANAPPAWSQVRSGLVLGVVTDASGARLEIFNALNQSNFFPVATRFDAADFGTTGTALDNRQIQLGLKFIF